MDTMESPVKKEDYKK